MAEAERAENHVGQKQEERQQALREHQFQVAETLAMTIARSQCLGVQSLIIKCQLLQELLRPEAMGADRPERLILETLPRDVMKVFQLLH
jgi:hypothetical protein